MALKINDSIPCNPNNKGQDRQANEIEYIVIHNTAGRKAYTAEAGAQDYHNNNKDGVCPHYFVDDENIYQSNSPLNASRHCQGGNWQNPDCPARNSNSIGIEMCEQDDKGTISTKTEENVIWLCQTLKNTYPSIKGIYRHSDVCGFGWKTCPRAFIGPDERINGSPTGAFADGATRFANFKTKVGIDGGGTFSGPTSNTGDSFMDIIKFLVSEGSKNKWRYFGDSGEYKDVHYGGKTFQVRPDCSGLAQAALQMLFDDQTIVITSHSLTDGTSDKILQPFGMTKRSFTSVADLQVGDILAKVAGNTHHVEIYAGNGQDYNWGGTEVIQSGNTVTTDTDWQVVWSGHQGANSGTSGGTYTTTSLYATLTGEQTSAIAEANERIIANLNEQGVVAEEADGYVKMDFSKTIKDVIKYTNVHKIDGLQYNPNAMTRKDFKQDYIVIVRKKLYFAGSMTSEENYLRLYVLDNWNSINTNHDTNSSENSASVTLTGGTRVTCINNESNVNYPDYETLLNSILSIDDEGESNEHKWRISDSSWNSTTTNVDYKSLIKARQAKYGWRYAEKCDFEPMDEIIIYSKSRYTKDESGKYIFRKIFFGFIESVQKTFTAGNQNPRIQISAKDQFKLLKQSYVNQSPSFFPGRFNNGKVDISFDTDKYGSFIYNEPLAYGLENASEEQLKNLQKKFIQNNIFAGQYADDILKQICSAAGIPDKYLEKRIEPIKKVPYLMGALQTSFDMYSASFETRANFASKIAEICFMEFFFDEEGNATFKIPTYVLGSNTLRPNNDNTDYVLTSFEGIHDKLISKDNSLQVVKQFCHLVEPILYTTTEGETLRDISNKFYNTINYAVEIQNLNIGQCQEYNTVKPLPVMTILVLKFNTQDKNARAEYRQLMANNAVTNYANRLYNQSIDEYQEDRKLTMAYLTDPDIRVIPDEDIISFTLTDSDQDIYTAVDIQGNTFMGLYDSDPSLQIRRTVAEWSAILKFGVRVATPVSTPFISSEDDAELLGNMMLLKSYAARYKGQLQLIEDCDIKVGTPIRLFTYDEHPNAEDEEYVQIADLDQKQSIYYVNSISRSISSSGLSTMTLSLTGGRMLGQESIFDIMDSLYMDFYKEPKDQDFNGAWALFNGSDTSSSSSTSSGGYNYTGITEDDLPSTIPGLENDLGDINNAKKIYLYTLNAGLNQSIEMACGWLGNAYAESRFNPDEVTGSHHGIYQWSDAPGDERWDGSTTLGGQLDLWKKELQSSEKNTYNELMNATTKTPENYADIIRLKYERCGNQGMESRRKVAKAFYEAWKDVKGSGTETPNENNTNNNTTTSNTANTNNNQQQTTQQKATIGDVVYCKDPKLCQLVSLSAEQKSILAFTYKNGLAQYGNRWAIQIGDTYAQPGQLVTLTLGNNNVCNCIVIDNYSDVRGDFNVGFYGTALPETLKMQSVVKIEAGLVVGLKYKTRVVVEDKTELTGG